jgi:pimeloyl-ACP methyl ester carboxylesterase
MDTIGYGDSDKPAHRYSMSDYAQSVIDFLDALNIERTSVVGHHTGAAIACEAAASHPDRVDKLILSGFPLYTQEQIESRRKGQVPEHLRNIEPLQIKADGAHLTNAWYQVWTLLRFQEKPLEEIHEIAMAILKSGPRNLEAHLALWQYEAPQRLPLIQSPTLILMAAEDEFCPQAEKIKNLIPESKVVIIKGGGAYFPRHEPLIFTEAVMTFLQSPGD